MINACQGKWYTTRVVYKYNMCTYRRNSWSISTCAKCHKTKGKWEKYVDVTLAHCKYISLVCIMILCKHMCV